MSTFNVSASVNVAILQLLEEITETTNVSVVQAVEKQEKMKGGLGKLQTMYSSDGEKMLHGTYLDYIEALDRKRERWEERYESLLLNPDWATMEEIEEAKQKIKELVDDTCVTYNDMPFYTLGIVLSDNTLIRTSALWHNGYTPSSDECEEDYEEYSLTIFYIRGNTTTSEKLEVSNVMSTITRNDLKAILLSLLCKRKISYNYESYRCGYIDIETLEELLQQ